VVVTMRRSLVALLAVTAACANDITEPTRPRAEVSATVLEFLPGVDVQTVSVTNTGGRPLEWSRQSTIKWLSAEPSAGTVAPGATQEITVRLTRAAAPLGTLNTQIVLEANRFEGPIVVDVVAHVPPTPVAELVSAPPVAYPRVIGSVTVRNASGRGELVWSGRADVDWIWFDVPFGAIPQGATSVIGFEIDRAAVPRDTVVNIILDSNDEAGPLVVPVYIHGNPPPLPLGPAISHVTWNGDAHFAVQTTGAPWLNSLTGLPIAVPLPGDATWMTPIGTLAAVPHATGFTIIERSTGAVRRVVEIGHRVTSIWVTLRIYAIVDGVPDGRIYAFDNLTGTLTENRYPMPPFRAMGGGLGGFVGGLVRVSTDDGIHEFQLRDAEVDLADIGGTGVAFHPGDGWFTLWSGTDVMLTSAGRIVRLDHGRADELDRFVDSDGTAISHVRGMAGRPAPPENISRTGEVAVIASTAGAPARMFMTERGSASPPLVPVALPPVEWEGGQHIGEPQYVYWQGRNDLVVVQRVATGPLAGHWFTTRFWRS
jgi:hypothetical protein